MSGEDRKRGGGRAGALRIDPKSEEWLRARLSSREGKEAVRRLVGIVARATFRAMPPELRATLSTPEGQRAFKEAWPEIVAAFCQATRKMD